MKKTIALLFFIVMFSCQPIVDKPKNLVSKNTMAEIIADLALNDQARFMSNASSMESGTKYILEQHHIKGKDFTDSYQYYIINDNIDGIYNDAQDIILEKNPASKAYILKNIKKEINNSTKIETLR